MQQLPCPTLNQSYFCDLHPVKLDKSTDALLCESTHDAPTDDGVKAAIDNCKILAREYLSGFNISKAFEMQPERFNALSVQAPYIFGDLSKCMWDEDVISALDNLAYEQRLGDKKALLFQGGVLNTTENRRVEHVWLRAQGVSVLEAMLDKAEQVRQSYPAITDVLHLGIGGSSLGPELAVDALQQFANTPIRIHFVSNIDGAQLHRIFSQLNPATTMVVAVSKSWSTLETLENLKFSMQWLGDAGITNPGSHVLAITAKPEKAKLFGVDQIVDFSEGIGGRFSIWSGVGFALAVSIGRAQFEDFLAGAREMDLHFQVAPPRENLPLLLGYLDVWNHAFLEYASRCVVPYTESLKLLPAYLQQLEMESNGKSASLLGGRVSTPTAPVVWGGVGTTSQHAFFQCLHQGTGGVPVEFLLIEKPNHPYKHLHKALNVNALAQAKALMQGTQIAGEQAHSRRDDDLHLVYPGNRPSSTVLLDEISPRVLGALFALYEHKTFVFGVLAGINSFDQFGVELGKRIASQLENTKHQDCGMLASSTNSLLDRLIPIY